MENVKLLVALFYRPLSAMSDIIDRGSWFFAAVLVFLVSVAFFATVNSKLETAYHVPNLYEFYQPNYSMADEDATAARAEYDKAVAEYNKALDARQKVPLVGDNFFRFFSFEPSAFFQPVLIISCFYVPATILLLCLFGNIGNFGIVIRRDYAALATCTMMAWAAAHLPFAIAGIALYSQAVSPPVYLVFWLVSGGLFGFLMIFALRTVFGATYGAAIVTVCLSWLAFSAGMYIFRYVSPIFFSPCLLIYAYMYFGGSMGSAGNAFRQKQNFKRFLHNATVNPRDADAHVQLALIYLQRRQEAKALEHLNRAVELDPNEPDANYELGKIARQKGELQQALNHFSIVVEQNDKHALSEIWREIGATYLTANMLTEARDALEKYVERRSADAEGLYHLGKVLKAQGETERAREMFEQAIESAKTSPDYRRRELRYWSNLAEKEI